MSSTFQLSQRYRLVPRAAVPAQLIGAAGLGYVIGSGVENMQLLRGPLPGATAAEIRAVYGDGALAAVTALAGAASLLLYVVFAATLAPRLPALLGGVVGPAIALAGTVASAQLVLDGGVGLSDAEVTSAFELQQTLRFLAGPFMALFLFKAARSGFLPRRLAQLARAVSIPLCSCATLPS